MALVLVQGRNSEAMSLYKLISRHSAPHVAKSAKRLLFGFTAGDYLKTHSITYIPATGLGLTQTRLHVKTINCPTRQQAFEE